MRGRRALTCRHMNQQSLACLGISLEQSRLVTTHAFHPKHFLARHEMQSCMYASSHMNSGRHLLLQDRLVGRAKHFLIPTLGAARRIKASNYIVIRSLGSCSSPRFQSARSILQRQSPELSNMSSKPSIPWSTDNKPMSSDASKEAKPPPRPSPSASVIVISGSNKILLLHRTRTSSAFPSAHVFPGGNLEPSDGSVPEDDANPARHRDNIAYRTGAIRELFEESGVLLARESDAPNQPLLSLDPDVRLAGRHDVHEGKISFHTWLKKQSPSAVLDTDALIPFTHWITPTNVPKRFTTQMYVYFVPVTERRRHLLATADQVETMSPEWKTASEWVKEADSGKIILFPPQYILLYLIGKFLDHRGDPSESREVPEEERNSRRETLRKFMLEDQTPVPWTDKFISPSPMTKKWKDGRQILALDKQGPELKESGLKGDTSRVVFVRFSKEGPREVEVMDRETVEAELARASASSKL